jgi:RES domain-containing protein
VPRRKWAPRTRGRFAGPVYRYINHRDTDPLDGRPSMRRGGRWNAPGTFAVVYTSCSLDVAVANLWRRYEGEVAQPWEESEEEQADLYEIQIDQAGLVDLVSADGIAGVGLPSTYPSGVSHATTRPIGRRLHRERRPGIWCRSAALASGEEVALFTDFASRGRVARPPRRLWEWFPVPRDSNSP